MDDFPDFRQFRYVLEIAERGGFRPAAERLNIAQPSLSRQAKAFQDFFKLSLFERTNSGRFVLTQEGEIFRALANQLLEAREETIAALHAIRKQTLHVLRLGCSSIVAPEICSYASALYKQLSPSSEIRPTLGDTAQLLEKLRVDAIDAAIVTLPLNDQKLRVMSISQDSLVVCLPESHPLSVKVALAPADLEGSLRIFRQPAQHPDAHERLIQLLGSIGIATEEHSHASHPSEAMKLVKDGYGFALLREGTRLESGLITKRIMGIDWTVDTVMVFKRESLLKNLPIIARSLRRKFGANGAGTAAKKESGTVKTSKDLKQKDLFGSA